MPVWHVSISLQHPKAGPLEAEPYCEAQAVELLADVGGDREWWYWSPLRIGHLRVALTDDEFAQVPRGTVTTDAGESGPERQRTHP